MWKWVSAAVVAGLAALIVPNLLEALERSRQKRSMADMRSIATGWEARAEDLKTFAVGSRRAVPPGTFHSVPLAELERALVPTYIRKLPRLDGWGNAFDVYVGGYDAEGRAKHYLVRSRGSDGRAETSRYRHGETSSFREDLVFANGNFIRHAGGI